MKRKGIEGGASTGSVSEGSSSEASSSDEDTNMLDVEFEWFDPQPEHDYHGIKTLLRQLFDADAHLFDLSALTNLILAQPLLGSTVKVEGNETDPYAFLTVLNLYEHRDMAIISDLTQYISDRCRFDVKATNIRDIMRGSREAQVGLVLTERLINVPSEVVPPMYKMLVEEISWALEEKEPYNFTHYLILSKTYREVASSLDEDDERSRKHKKQRKSNGKIGEEIFYFHPEDEVLQSHASSSGSFEYKSEVSQSDSKRAFQELGIQPQGHMVLLEAARFEAAVKAVQQYFGQS